MHPSSSYLKWRLHAPHYLLFFVGLLTATLGLAKMPVPGPSLLTNATPNPVCIDNSVNLSATASGGTAPYSYTWVAPAGVALTTSANAPSVTALVGSSASVQTFTVTVADNANLTTTQEVSVTVIEPPTRLYVNGAATGQKTGLSWPNAFTSLQAALNYTCNQHLAEIWIAGGTYKPASAGNQAVSFQIPSGVQVYGGFVGGTVGNPTGETALSERPAVNPITGNPSSTTFSGDIDNDNLLNVGNSRNLVTFSNASAATRLDGVVITGGNTDNNRGGGIRIAGGSPTLENLWITANGASNGGGGIATTTSTTLLLTTSRVNRHSISGEGAGIHASGPLYLTGVDVSQNTVSGGRGGGIFQEGTGDPLLLVNSRLNENLSGGPGGAIYAAGSVTVTGSMISQNTAGSGGSGGGIFANDAAVIDISSSTLTLNLSIAPGGGLHSGRGSEVLIRIQSSVMNQNRSTSANGGAINTSGNSTTLLMNGVTMNQNRSNSPGGAINMTGPIYLTDCSVSQNTATSNGGAIFQQGSGHSFSATSTTISQNHSNGPGGAVYAAGNTYLIGCSVNQNQVNGSGEGGSFYIGGATVVNLVSSTLNQNQSGSSGGALYKSSGSTVMTLTDVTMNNNQGANGNGGGAVYAGGSTTLVMNNVQMRQNRISGGGGGVNVNGPVYLTNCNISQNTATGGSGSGGGIHQTSGGGLISFSAVSSTVSQNVAGWTGGGVNAQGDVYLTGCEVSQNTIAGSNGNGGGINANSAQVFQVRSSTLSQNQAAGFGGAIAHGEFRPNLFTLTDVVMTGNRTTVSHGQGGAVYSSNPVTTLVMTNVQIRQNSSGSHGGGISVNGPVYVTGCDISQNTATGSPSDGGGLYINTAIGPVQITNSRFVQNQCLSDGGALRNTSSIPVLIVNSLFSRNVSTSDSRYGGAIRSTGSLTAVNSTFSSNSAANGSGLSLDAPSLIQNSIVWGNSGQPFFGASANQTLTHSLVEAAANGTYSDGGNNLTANPIFLKPVADDLRLVACSPAINAGSNALYTAVTASTTDVAGLARIASTAIDMGAHEFQGNPGLAVGLTSGTLTCASTTVTLTATSTGGISYTFANSSGTVIGTPGAASSVTVNAEGTYSVTVATAEGCVSSTTASVTSNTIAPEVSLSSSAAKLNCTRTSVTLTAASSGTSLVWNTNATSTSITVSTPGEYAFTATGANGCTAVATSVTIGQNTAAPGGPTLMASPSAMLSCAQPSLTLTASATGSGLTYAFGGPSGVLAGSGNTRVVTASGIYSMTVTGSNSCTASAAIGISSNVAGTLPTASLGASLSSVCEGENVRVVATVAGFIEGYQWYKDGQQVSGQTSATLSLGNLQPTQSGSYSLVLTGFCSVTSAGFTLTVKPQPVVSITQSGTVIQVTGGSMYEFVQPIERINGFEIRRTAQNQNGFFPFIQTGMFWVNVTGQNGCVKRQEATSVNP